MIDDDSVKLIARLAHEVNKSYCESIGDTSQVGWNSASKWQRDSAINGVKMHIKFPDSTPEDSHKSWLKEKLDNGWVYGVNKDEELKTHPCCIEYDKLPRDQKVKDYLFKAIVNTMVDIDKEDYET